VLTTAIAAQVPEALAHVPVVSVVAGDAAQLAQAAGQLANATGVWVVADSCQQFADALRGTGVATELFRLVHRDGVLGGNGDVIKALTEVSLVGGHVHATVGVGLDVVPGAVIDAMYDPKMRRNRLLGVLAGQPDLVGLAVEPETVAVLHRRFVDVFGSGSAYACLAANEHRGVRIERIHADISPRTQRRAAPEAVGERGSAAIEPRRSQRRSRGDAATSDRPYRARRLQGLVAMSREAAPRTGPRFPATQPPKPEVPSGSLIIIGGGGSPPGFMEKFIELAGGKDALLLYVPCTESEEAAAERTLASWRRAGASNVDFIHTKDRHMADTSTEIHDKLRRAGGLFFGGGRQWNLVDSWQHTEAHRLMHEVLARGGVIAGSSAGASIQGSYMPRGNSLGNVDAMAEGYETGLGFLTGVAIDQHFTQRGRHPDMTALVNHYPQLLGIGLDEAAAIIVRGTVATCLCREGRYVHFYDRNVPVVPTQPDYVQLSNGQRFDLASRTVLASAEAIVR